MRKQNSWITILLAVLVMISFLFSYFILYDMSTFEKLIDTDDGEEEIITESIKPQTSNHSTPTKLSFHDVVSSDKYIIRLGQQSYFIRDRATINTLRSLIESRPIIIEDVTMRDDPVLFNNLLAIDHLQLELPTRMPIGAYTRMLSIEEDTPTDVLIDRVIIPLASEEENSVYLVDSETSRFIEATLSTNLKKEELRNAVTLEKSELIEVLRYDGATKPIYLPVHNTVLDTELFTLDSVRENVFLSKIFTNNDYNTTELNRVNETILRYQNYLNTLEINQSSQRFNLTIGRADPGDPRSTVEKYKNAYSMVQNFEHWSGDLRLFSVNNSYITFRRYYNGIPILTKSTVTDYGANIAQFRSDLSGDIYRYYQPMVFFYAHINTESEPVELLNHEELLDLIQMYGYRVSGFKDIFVAYEWQEDMEGFKKAELVPTWFFQLGNSYYTLAELQTSAFESIWDDYMSANVFMNEGGEN